MSFQKIQGGQQPGFIFGGNTGVSYDQLKRKREQAEKLSQSLSRTPTTFAGGLSAIGQGLLLRATNRKADAMEAEGRKGFDSVFQELVANKIGGGRPSAPGRSAQSTADPQMASAIRKGLIDRGLPEHVAGGFVTNFQDESGLNPGINEHQPLVSGSRGGFGLAQWTGPRREALEKFAVQRGTDVSDLDTQLDFLMTELQGSEAAAAKHILSAKDAGGAADAILRQFLRPAPEHVKTRSARYTGGSTGGADIAQIASAAASPWATPEQKSVLGVLLQQRMTQADPMRQLQMEKASLELHNLSNPKPETKVVDGHLVNASTGEVLFGGEGGGVDFETEQKLRKEFSALPTVKDFSKINDSWDRIQAAGQDPTAAGDMALIFNFMKLLDPGSVVRESEFATAENAGAVSDRIRNIYNRVLQGERLAPEQRADFLNRAGQLFNAQAGNYNDSARQYRHLAEQYQLSPDRIAQVVELYQVTPEQAAEALAGGGETTPPDTVSNSTGNISIDSTMLEYMTPEERALFE